ncbi:hypothetical protein [Vibrio cionasavignyae]
MNVHTIIGWKCDEYSHVFATLSPTVVILGFSLGVTIIMMKASKD